MRILIITIDYPPPYGGIATFTRTIEDGLKSNGHLVKVLNFDSRNTNNYKHVKIRDGFYSRATLNSYFSIWNVLNPFKLFDFEGGFRDFIFTNMVARISRKTIEDFKPDLIHLMHSRIYSSIFKTKVPVILSCYSEEINQSYPVKYVLDHANKIHSISNFTKNKILEIAPNRVNDIAIIPVSINVDAYGRTKKGKQFRLITVCRLDKAKNVFNVVKALNHLPKDVLKNISYTIIGVGEDFDTIKDALPKLNLEKTVKLLGKVSDKEKIRLLSTSSAFIMCPTKYKDKQEGFGIVYLEARASGLPIIASKIGGIPEAVEQAGLYVENELNPKEIAEKIEELYSDKLLNEKLIQKSDRTIKNFDDSVLVKKIIDLYRTV